MSLKIHPKAKQGVIVRRASKRARLLRKLRNVTISALVLLIVLGAGGFVYTWYMGEHGPQNPSAFEEPTKSPKAPSHTPAPRVANAPISASIQSLTSPVTPGSNASVTIRTAPEANCTISVIYDKTASTDSGLAPQKADVYGMASWAWTVEATTPLGKWPVKVTCELDKKSAMMQGDLVVAKEIN